MCMKPGSVENLQHILECEFYKQHKDLKGDIHQIKVNDIHNSLEKQIITSQSTTSDNITLTSNAEVSQVAPPGRSDLTDITSPMVGTFYRAPGPEEPPFVEIGSRINVGQAVCILEAMKLMNELESEVSGEVIEILVENGTPVEFGQVLMRLKPV